MCLCLCACEISSSIENLSALGGVCVQGLPSSQHWVSRFQVLALRELEPGFPCSALGSPLPHSTTPHTHPSLLEELPDHYCIPCSKEAAAQQPLISSGRWRDEGPDPAATEFLPDPPCAGLGRAACRGSRSVMRFLTWELPEWPTFCQNSYKIITQQFSHTDRKNTA